MKEEEIKKIVQNSILETSDGFVDDLMNKVEIREATTVSLVWSVQTVILAISIIVFLLAFLCLKSSHISHYVSNIGFSIPKLPLLWMISLIFLSSINYLLRLNEEYKCL